VSITGTEMTVYCIPEYLIEAFSRIVRNDETKSSVSMLYGSCNFTPVFRNYGHASSILLSSCFSEGAGCTDFRL
jgi:hypothetical protein